MSVAPSEVELPESGERTKPDKPWLTIVWNDPINLMDYVTYVFQTVFGYPKSKAKKLMLDVHYKGRAVVAAGARAAERVSRRRSGRQVFVVDVCGSGARARRLGVERRSVGALRRRRRRVRCARLQRRRAAS